LTRKVTTPNGWACGACGSWGSSHETHECILDDLDSVKQAAEFCHSDAVAIRDSAQGDARVPRLAGKVVLLSTALTKLTAVVEQLAKRGVK
jgi:hypothetical protein